MIRYLPTTKAKDAGHKLARIDSYVLTTDGGLAYPDTIGGFIFVDAAAVAQFLADGWLALAVPMPEVALGDEEKADDVSLVGIERSRRMRPPMVVPTESEK